MYLFQCSLRIILHLKEAFLFLLAPYLPTTLWLLLPHPLLLRQPSDTLGLKRLLANPALDHQTREHKGEVYFSTLLALAGLLWTSLMVHSDHQEGE